MSGPHHCSRSQSDGDPSRCDGPCRDAGHHCLGKPEEALDIGLYDYLDSGCYCIIEWPENIGGLLPEEALKVGIRVNPDESRTVFWED